MQARYISALDFRLEILILGTCLVRDAGLETQQLSGRFGSPVDPGHFLVKLGCERGLGRVLLGRVGLRLCEILDYLDEELAALRCEDRLERSEGRVGRGGLGVWQAIEGRDQRSLQE